jgi:hypothetical protein
MNCGANDVRRFIFDSSTAFFRLFAQSTVYPVVKYLYRENSQLNVSAYELSEW